MQQTLRTINWAQVVVSVVLALISSTGFWSLIAARQSRNTAESKMLLGLGHDRIMDKAMRYIDRGWITQDEYEDLELYLYRPYCQLGGNGSAKRIMEEVNKLPIRSRYQHNGGNNK